MTVETNKTIEVRGFLHLDKIFRTKFGTIPLIHPLDEPITGIDLANQLGIDPKEIEVIFVNGFVQALDYEVQPGDRVAFLPPGCPGPYRIALGFYGKNQNNEANFKIVDQINVTVRLFATLRENREKETAMELPRGSAPKDIVQLLDISPKDAAIIMINGRGASLDSILEDKDTVSIFPPVGGG
jgi:molybdopterin converting factor small subunit